MLDKEIKIPPKRRAKKKNKRKDARRNRAIKSR